jgi:hypothetical protein
MTVLPSDPTDRRALVSNLALSAYLGTQDLPNTDGDLIARVRQTVTESREIESLLTDLAQETNANLKLFELYECATWIMLQGKTVNVQSVREWWTECQKLW